MWTIIATLNYSTMSVSFEVTKHIVSGTSIIWNITVDFQGKRELAVCQA